MAKDFLAAKALFAESLLSAEALFNESLFPAEALWSLVCRKLNYKLK